MSRRTRLTHSTSTLPLMPCLLFRSIPALKLACPLGLLLLFLRALPYSSAHGISTIQPEDACADFSAGSILPGSSWTLENCIDVWNRFATTVPNGLRRRLPTVDIWGQSASELRRAGSPCLVASDPTSDGAGSSTIRHFATWIFASEMGCDWVTPDWGKRHVEGGNGTVVYCHRTATTEEMDFSRPPNELKALRRCSVIDWLAYFQFGVPSVSVPEDGEVKIIQASNKCSVILRYVGAPPFNPFSSAVPTWGQNTNTWSKYNSRRMLRYIRGCTFRLKMVSENQGAPFIQNRQI